MSDSAEMRFLVKARAPISGSFALGLTGTDFKFSSEPLFKSVGSVPGLGIGAGAAWHLVTTDLPATTTNQWDVCHQLISGSSSFAAAGVEFAEPDLEQKWPISRSGGSLASFSMREGDPEPQNGRDFPSLPDNLWFRDANHGQFDAALSLLGDPGQGKRVRIAHLDTGFDPSHKTRPAFISAAEQRNFVDAGFPNDATDRSSGILNNFSHGTGTLSILAGSAVPGSHGFGCAPNAEIVPVRVADRVVLFRNSAIAKALDYVHGLCRDKSTFIHVVTMSMGGVPSQAWAEAINALYDAGVFVVTAAGNNYANLPTHLIVYPARFNRVVAACGVMADGKPYADLKLTLMAGDYGPNEKMPTAISAYTPNIPWARFGEPAIVDFDGAGTSAATPQVAGAAALWIQKNRSTYDAYGERWMAVEAVRAALFENAARDEPHADHLGAGRLRAKDALATPKGKLTRQPEDDAGFALAHLVLGMGLAASPAQNAMLELELRQVLQATGLEGKLTETNGGTAVQGEVVRQLLTMPTISRALRAALSGGSAGTDRTVVRSAPDDHPVEPPDTRKHPTLPMERLNAELAVSPAIPPPATRKLRVFAYDPTLQTDPSMFGVNEATVSVQWEPNLGEGPTGEYLEVVDIDPASGFCYAPLDLNHPHLLATNGYAPSEANPQFHQQMVYAVAMRTITRFERALGRKALWAPRMIRNTDGDVVQRTYVQRLRIYPHAMREQNAFYSSPRMGLLFGYFAAGDHDDDTSLPGSQIFCAVSHDIIAHETTHALLDGLHPRYQEATNPDVLAFHEGFADIVALFQHFTIPEALLQQIKRTRGDVSQESLLGQLAVQFGKAAGMHGALRSAIGQKNEKGEWQISIPKRTDYEDKRSAGEPHALGSILVSAVFAAFATIYRARSADLVRLATNGTGVLPAGDISHDLAMRLAQEAARVADQVLNICIRALDYCPPVDITFGEYLRAIVTADRDLVLEDDRGYRVAFIAAFRDRGIFPKDVAHLAEDSLAWVKPPLDPQSIDDLAQLIGTLDLDWNLNSERQTAYESSEKNRFAVWKWLVDGQRTTLLAALGFEPASKNVSLGPMSGEMRSIEVHSVRPTRRAAPDGTTHGWLVIEITQTFRASPSQERFRGGCTLIFDLSTNEPKYIIRKRLRGSSGVDTQLKARAIDAERAAISGTCYFPPGDPTFTRETFALLHRLES
jgi:subtilisin family serine protease